MTDTSRCGNPSMTSENTNPKCKRGPETPAFSPLFPSLAIWVSVAHLLRRAIYALRQRSFNEFPQRFFRVQTKGIFPPLQDLLAASALAMRVWRAWRPSRRTATAGCNASLICRIATQRSRAFCGVGGVWIHCCFCATSEAKSSAAAVRPRLRGVEMPPVIEVSFRMIREFPQLACSIDLISSAVDLRRLDRQVQRGRKDHEARRREAEEPLDQRSVTWSYFAPPMPCRNRSPRTSRAQSVVTSARERIFTPWRPSSSSRLDGCGRHRRRRPAAG